jgi:hypothetical protein
MRVFARAVVVLLCIARLEACVPVQAVGAMKYESELRQLHEHYGQLFDRLSRSINSLEQYGLHLGRQPTKPPSAEYKPLECALCTEEHPMSCRQLIEAMPGHKVIAPCNCEGTQKVKECVRWGTPFLLYTHNSGFSCLSSIACGGKSRRSGRSARSASLRFEQKNSVHTQRSWAVSYRCCSTSPLAYRHS